MASRAEFEKQYVWLLVSREFFKDFKLDLIVFEKLARACFFQTALETYYYLIICLIINKLSFLIICLIIC
jgi:hypothetical protein